nr:MAG TPA: hypothetical protein [Caudoviricetes sp.]
MLNTIRITRCISPLTLITHIRICWRSIDTV